MNAKALPGLRSWVVWGILAAATLLGIWRYPSRSAFPFETQSGPEGLEIKRVTSAEAVPSDWPCIESACGLLAVEGVEIHTQSQLRLLIAGGANGDVVRVSVASIEPSAEIAEHEVILVPYAPPGERLADTLALALVSVVLLALAFFLHSRSEQPACLPLAALFALLGAALALDEAGGRVFGGVGRWLPAALWAYTYALFPAAMVSFASIYPFRSRLWGRIDWLRPALWLAGVLVGTCMTVGIFLWVTDQSTIGVALSRVAQQGLRVLMLAGTLLVAISLAVAVKDASDHESRNRIGWILVGVVIGAGPPLLLVYLPRLLNLTPVLPEPIANLFLLAIPICLVISVVRHRLLNIELVLRQGLIYGPATIGVYVVFGGVAVAAMYLLLDLTLEFDLPALTIRFAMVLALPVVVFHLLYEPLRRRTQRFIDGLFYRSKYRFGRTVRAFSERVNHRLSAHEVFHDLKESIQSTIEPTWMRIVDATGEWRSAWPTVEAPSKGMEPHATIGFPEQKGLELHLGSRKSGLAVNEYDKALLTSLVNMASIFLRREMLQRQLLQEESERERLEAEARLKDSFLSLVSHDLRSPLAAISLSAAAITHQPVETVGKTASEAARRIERNSARLGEMVERLMHAALLESDLLTASIGECSIREIVDGVIERFQVIAENAEVDLECDIAADVTVRADQALLTEALSNLVDNATRHSPAGAAVRVTALQAEASWRISVSDSGGGVPEEARETLFSGRVRGDRVSTGGFGLGLDLTRQLMELQGGAVELSSTGSAGSVFTLILPE